MTVENVDSEAKTTVLDEEIINSPDEETDMESINQNLQDTKVSGVTLRFQERTYISTLVKQNNGLYKYQSVEKLVPVSEEKITIEDYEHMGPIKFPISQ